MGRAMKKSKVNSSNENEINNLFAEIAEETAAVETKVEETIETNNEVTAEDEKEAADYFNPELSGKPAEKTPKTPKATTPKAPKQTPETSVDLTNGLLYGFLKKSLVPSTLWNAIYYKYLPENNIEAIKTIARKYPETFAKIGDGSSYKFSKESNIIINQIKNEMTVMA